MVLTGNVPIERISGLFFEGAEYFQADDPKAGCAIWLQVWDAIKTKCQRSACHNLELLDEQFRGAFFVSNFVQDFDMKLRDAGLRDKVYFQKRIDYCTEFLTLFSEADDNLIAHRKRSIAESYAYLGDYERADLEFGKIVREHPHGPWGYIPWGDIYCFGGCDGKTDYDKAKSLYRKALAVAKDEDDILVVQERLQSLEDDDK